MEFPQGTKGEKEHRTKGDAVLAGRPPPPFIQNSEIKGPGNKSTFGRFKLDTVGEDEPSSGQKPGLYFL